MTMTFLVSGYTSLCLPEVCEGCLFSHMLLNLKIFARSVYKVEHMFSRVLAARAFSLVMCLYIFSVRDSVKTFCLFLNDF